MYIQTGRFRSRPKESHRRLRPNGCVGLGSADSLEIELQTNGQRPLAGQFIVEGQRVQAIILVGQVQQAQTRLDSALQQAVSDVKIELPEVVSGEVGRVTAVGLLRPNGVE